LEAAIDAIEDFVCLESTKNCGKLSRSSFSSQSHQFLQGKPELHSSIRGEVADFAASSRQGVQEVVQAR
jgi:hypothetical protein